MESRKLRINLLIAAMMFIIGMAHAANPRQVSFATAGEQLNLNNNNNFGFELEFRVHEYNLESISTKLGTYDQLSIEGYGNSNRIGEPQLPMLSRLIYVPLNAQVSFDIYRQQQLDIASSDTRLEHQIIPVQASLSKSADPATASFAKNNDVYGRNALLGSDLFQVEEIGMMRAVRVFRITYSPVKYNPVTGELQIISEAGIRVSFDNPDFSATEALMAKTASYL